VCISCSWVAGSPKTIVGRFGCLVVGIKLAVITRLLFLPDVVDSSDLRVDVLSNSSYRHGNRWRSGHAPSTWFDVSSWYIVAGFRCLRSGRNQQLGGDDVAAPSYTRRLEQVL
jgi:hypothetical protein